MIDLPTRFTRELFARPHQVFGAPYLSPDNDVLYFTRERAEADIWLLTLNSPATVQALITDALEKGLVLKRLTPRTNGVGLRASLPRASIRSSVPQLHWQVA